MAIAGLTVNIGAKSQQFHKEMARIKKRTRGLGTSFKRMAAGLAAFFSVRMVGAFISKLDAIGKHAKRLQITTDEYQKLSFAAERSGLAIEDIENAFKKLDKMIHDSKRGLSTAKMAFEDLGVSANELDKMGQVEKLQAVTNALDLMSHKGTVAALAQELLSRSGMKLIPLFGKLIELFKKSEERGIIDPKSIQAAEDLADEITDLKTSLTAMATDTGAIVFLKELTDLLHKGVKGGRDFANEIDRLSGVQIQARFEGATGPGLDRGFWTDYGEMLADFVTFGYTKEWRKNTGRGKEGVFFPAPEVKEQTRFKTFAAARVKSAKIEAKAITDIKKKAAERDEKIKRNQAESSLLRRWQELQKTMKLEGQGGQGGRGAPGRDVQDDRLRRIGINLGNVQRQILARERNQTLKDIRRKLDELKEINRNIDTTTRAV